MLRSKIDNEIFNLTMHPPASELMNHRDQLLKSNLAYIFSSEEITKALENAELDPHVYSASSTIISKDEESTLNNCILFVARGNIIEKTDDLRGDLDVVLQPKLIFKRGNCACL